MATSLPTDDAATKSVDTFGLGTYDGFRDDDTCHGEDDEHREPSGESLPSEPAEGFDTEFFLSYPQETALGPKHASIDWFFSSILPGDGDRPPPSPRPADKTIDDLAAPPSDVRTGDSALPTDEDNPAARSDYYDHMTMGSILRAFSRLMDGDYSLHVGEDEYHVAVGDDRFWPSEDSGSYVSNDVEKGESPEAAEESGESGVVYEDGQGHYVDEEGYIESFPEPETNDSVMDDSLGALGNAWSGYVVEDESNPRGFPSQDFMEEADFMDENPILPESWHLQPFGYASSRAAVSTRRMAMNSIEKVQKLTSDFLKEHGKKNIVKRSVMAFLQDLGLPQYLSSDIVRCLKEDHKIVIPDVLDTFPISAHDDEDVRRMASIHAGLVAASMSASTPEASAALCRAAARVATAAAALGRGNI